MIWILIALVLIVLGYYKVKKAHSYWSDRGVKHVEPTFLIGNQDLARRDHLSVHIMKLCDKLPNERYMGTYIFLQPLIMLRDPELVKKICVKEFDTFPEHRTFASEEIDPLWAKNLFQLNGEKWRDLRPTLSPAFTSSKMKFMFELMHDCSLQLVDHFKSQKGDVIELEMKDVFSRYANDVIASTAFGLKCDSLKNRNNDFYLMGKDATNFGGLRFFKFIMYSFSPTLMQFFNIKLIPKKVGDFFGSIIEETIETRESKGIIRQDMIHLLLEAKKGRLVHEEKTEVDTGFSTAQESEMGKAKKPHKKEITNEDITSQALIFFLAGFDTVSTLMCFTAYELALNPDIQDRLRNEIRDTLEEHNGKTTYESILGMKYLDMVVTETLRKWPPTPLTDRKAVRNFTIEPERPGEKPVVIEKGILATIPIYSFHRSPEYYENPEKFDPERFSDENKHNIKPYTYMPFGVGPRNCIGSRFSLLETKLIIVHLLNNFEFVPIKKTPIPLVLDPKQFGLTAKGGFWLGLKKLTK